MSAWLCSAVTHTGKIRRVNEDAYLCLKSQGFWAVADGMGGHAAGDYASHLITTSLSQFAYKDKRLNDISAYLDDKLTELNGDMIEYAKEHEASAVGSTVASIALNKYGVGLAHWVGDSCIFHHRSGRLKKISHDHSLVQELIDIGELTEAEAAYYPSKNVITRAVGASKAVYPEVRLFDYQPRDMFLLCSDGLTNEISQTELQTRFNVWLRDLSNLPHATASDTQNKHKNENEQIALETLCDELLSAALEKTASDNITFVLVFITS